MIAETEARATNHFSASEAGQIAERLEQLSGTIKSAFGMVIYSSSYTDSRLVKVASAFPLAEPGYSDDLERIFPALSVKAARMLNEASRTNRTGISPIDLIGGESFLIIATPEDVIVCGAKTPNSNFNHELLRSMIAIVADSCDDKELQTEMDAFNGKIVDFERRKAAVAAV